MPEIHGTCDERFSAVREAFANNFEEFGEVGACAAVCVDGRGVVDLWAGHTDGARSREWRPDTIANVYSTTKGLAALVVLRLVERGLVDLDAPMARYWPEFGAAGKEAIPVRQCMSHQAGVPAIRKPLPPDAMFDAQKMAAALADEAPWWEPGTQHGYHAVSYGWFAAELVRRLDGRDFGTFVREDVAGPLGIDFVVGVGEADDARCAELLMAGPPPPGIPNLLEDELEQRPESMTSLTFNNPDLDIEGVNNRAWRAAQIPAGNGHTNARALARFYGALAKGGSVDGVTVLDAGLIEAARQEQTAGPDAVLWQLPTRFGVGFMLTQDQPASAFGPNPGAFGHPGMGGSLGFADPEAGVGFGYVMNQMRLGILVDDRAARLIDAVYSSL